MSNRRPCYFFPRRGGCRNGSRCNFAHILPPRTTSPSPQTIVGNERQSESQASESESAPRGVCRNYWNTGQCRLEFNCQFRHERPSEVRTESEGTLVLRGVPLAPPSIDSLAPFLTDAGVAKISGPGADVFSSSVCKGLTPQETHTFLRRYTLDDYRFHNVNQIYHFVALLNNASSQNRSWTDEDGQLLLTAISSGNGLLRLEDAISWQPVSTSAGEDPMTLSFQRGFLPILQYYSSSFIVKSTLKHFVNKLYGLLDNNIEHVTNVLEDCLGDLMRTKSFQDRKDLRRQYRSSMLSGSEVFAPILNILFEYLTRFKNASVAHKNIGSFVDQLSAWIEEWIEDISSLGPSFDDPLTKVHEHRHLIIQHLKDRSQKVFNIIERERAALERSSEKRRVRDAKIAVARANTENTVGGLDYEYEGPGEERQKGPRHDNDFIEIAQIKIAPTNEELVCNLSPYLPANVPNAPHTYPPDSIQRLLDIQFRLLREELTAPLRTSVRQILDDINSPQPSQTRLHGIRNKNGGRYQYQDHHESVLFNVYTGVHFEGIQCDRYRSIVAEISFDTPPGSARSESASRRTSYWEGRSGKRLMQGGLIALVWCQPSGNTVHLGIVTSPNKDIVQCVERDRHRITAKIHFFEAVVNVQILESLRTKANHQGSLLIESAVMFETIRPFLESLKREPETFPFQRYLVHPISNSLSDLTINPPRYSLMPNYHFQLKNLLKNPTEVDNVTLKTDDQVSVAAVRADLKERSRLDPSQVDAVIDTLTREVSLIQGPPGTGKTFVGIELMRVLIENNVKPILMISFTNHSLDNMLGSILDSKITSSVVRLGSRGNDERVAPYSIGELERTSNRSRLANHLRGYAQRLKVVEEEMAILLRVFVDSTLQTESPNSLLMHQYGELWDSLNNPPQWIKLLFHAHATNNEKEWNTVSRNGKHEVVDSSIFGFWLSGMDLVFLQQPEKTEALRSHLAVDRMEGPRIDTTTNLSSSASYEQDEGDNEDSDSDSYDGELEYEFQWQERLATVGQNLDREGGATAKPQEKPRIAPHTVPAHNEISETTYEGRSFSLSDVSDVKGFFRQLGETSIPRVPTTNRDVAELLASFYMWDMSLQERKILAGRWDTEVRESLFETRKRRFIQKSEEHASLREKQQSSDEEVRLQILRGADIVGCTTTGAAKLTSMLKGLSPKVMLVEEAGQVLESHVLGSLVESVEHLILIGDPKQLRPTLNNYSLSMNNRRGRKLYRFDMSLMERLSSYGLAMTPLNTQRRMRPEISSLVRNLYPGLINHEDVNLYPHVRGMQKDVFLLSHANMEQGGGEDSESKHNTYEVDMIKDLVLYLLRQGPYSKEGSIVVLCAYLGQLSKVRLALSSEVTVVMDERDEVALGEQELDEPMVEQVRVSQRVKIRSIDNYQGEEADIIVLSLVRNSGSGGEIRGQTILETRQRQNIGFLKSENRINVALSRARHGLYILGNASDLSGQSFMWASVVDKLTEQGAIGDQLPITCHRHPEEVRLISKPGELPRWSPDGGCLQTCDFRLPCGHTCPFKCHSDDEQHRSVKCVQPCQNLCQREHPCSKYCADDCGKCSHSIKNVKLPCGHTAKSVECWRLNELSDVFCHTTVKRQLPNCEHTAEVECGVDIDSVACQTLCDEKMACCGRPCRSKCSECQKMSRDKPSVNLDTQSERMQRTQSERMQRMQHKSHSCGKPLHCQHSCSGTCGPEHTVCNDPCKSACRQVCSHSRCPLPCSEACSPCQQRCTWSCSHQTCPVPCGSVCARLPCDVPCKNTLSCGHLCSSVCGEPCHVQTCLTCSPHDRLQNIADFIMQRPLHELRPELGTLDELIITLPGCGHAFTVDTLDRHCKLTDYYEKDGQDEWRGLKMPPLGYKKPPTCPTCRNAITSPRYGRVFKRADLDILEINVASEMARSLHSATSMLASFDRVGTQSLLKKTVNSLKHDNVDVSNKVMRKRHTQREKLMKSKGVNDLPIKSDALDPGSLKYYGVSKQAASAWREAIGPLQRSYDQALKVASARSAHTKAWEAAFSCLLGQRGQPPLQNLGQLPQAPGELDIRAARMKVGQLKPLADTRFLVEALWLTIEIRQVLANLATTWLNPTPLRPKYQSSHGRIWADYILFLLKSSERDAQRALHVAEQSGSQRQMIRSRVFIYISRLEIFKFAYRMSKEIGASADDKQKLADQAKEMREELHDAVEAEIRRHLEAGERALQQDDFATLFEQPARMIICEWDELEKELRSPAVYNTVTFEERIRIIGALVNSYGLSYSGHFFTCPNGHPFVITECGGAIEVSRCPECRELIGGGDHSLHPTNLRDTGMEHLFRDQSVPQHDFVADWLVKCLSLHAVRC